mgnify:CR=1 FL=1
MIVSARRRLNTHIHYYLRIEVSQFWRIALLLYWQKKIETILSRGDQSTRPRDYYDVFLLLKLFEERIDFSVLFEAIHKTATRRNSVFIFSDYPNILDSVKHSKEMQKRWEIYQYEYSYAQHIIFDDICDLIKTIMDKEKVL